MTSFFFHSHNSSLLSPRSKAAAGKMLLYESFAQATALGDLHTCLMMDMKACQEDDVRLLCYLTPSIYSEVPWQLCRCVSLVCDTVCLSLSV